MARISSPFSKRIVGGAFALAIFAPFQHARASDVIYSFSDQNGDGAYPSAGVIIDRKGDLYGTTGKGGGNGCGGAGCGTVFRLSPNGTETVLHSFAGGSDGANPSAAVLRGDNRNMYGTTVSGGANGDGVVFRIAKDGTETILYTFAGGNDGSSPRGGLIEDKAGNLYGATSEGGGTGCGGSGCGTVFQLAPSGAYSVLHAFAGSDGANPYAGLIRDRRGNLYGTTVAGGSAGDGTVFKLAPNGIETVLYSFTGGSDGGSPQAGLIRDKAGNLYGTTTVGGNFENFCYPTGKAPTNLGCGTVFEIAKGGTETVLYSFCPQTNCWDGSIPYAGLIMDNGGNLYGTTTTGGTAGYGVVFEVSSTGSETVLHFFENEQQGDGDDPLGGVIMDGAGNLYGTTYYGTDSFEEGCYGIGGCGTVFKLTP